MMAVITGLQLSDMKDIYLHMQPYAQILLHDLYSDSKRYKF